ncbi:MAG: hypothetical protein R8J85_10000, partial [Mariprofundales bacterium]
MKKWIGIVLAVVIGASNVWAASSLDSANYHLKAGQAYVAQGRDADALKEYEAALTRDDKMFAAWASKAEVLLRLQRGEAAATAIERLKDLEENKAQKATRLLMTLEYQQMFKPHRWFATAKTAFFQARKITPKSGALQLWVARAYRDDGKAKLAEKHYAKAVEFGGSYAVKATAELSAMRRKATAGGTGKGVAGELAAQSVVDRATLAALVMNQLPMQRVFAHRSVHIDLPKDAQN